ncbi:NAD(P)/FAD-dependent oxidoreductase [Sinomonas notoginsengisoli]|uniref:NAD(P)/FAD-dependent oxidoreductase n=1 Tax=Sinomonas notoginsengisoli TaxID=1457311 RepID=UPI001F48CBB7|nr:NAD(P)/FAD-dependent oxidoreductase [Sinomonas notoginsengisoli]
MDENYEVIVVGGGFAGVAAARTLGRKGVRVLLIDKNPYHQFQPLLYQVATLQLGVSEVARSLRDIFRGQPNIRLVAAEVTGVDAERKRVTTSDGKSYEGRFLILASGAEANFFNTPGAEHTYPLYSVGDAVKVGGTLSNVLEDADRADDGKQLDFVVIGAGPTGVETAGALAETVKYVLPDYFSPWLANRCRVHLVDMVPNVLNVFSDKSKEYAGRRLAAMGVQLHLGTPVAEITEDKVLLKDGTEIPATLVVWAGGLKAGAVVAGSGLPQGRGGRIDVNPDLTAPGFDDVYVLGDAANMTDAKGNKLPQLGSCALQAGTWAAKNILADIEGGGRHRAPFGYVDKGYMAMVGRGSAVAEVGPGPKRVLLNGPLAFLAWLGVHVVLLSGALQKIRAVATWPSDYITHRRSFVVLSRPDGSQFHES